MIRAHLRRSFGGGLDGPLRDLSNESVARAKPALEADRATVSENAFVCSRSSVVDSYAGVFHVRAPALPAQSPGGRFRKGGEAPLRVASTPRVRLSGAALQLGASHRSRRRSPAGS